MRRIKCATSIAASMSVFIILWRHARFWPAVNVHIPDKCARGITQTAPPPPARGKGRARRGVYRRVEWFAHSARVRNSVVDSKSRYLM